MKKVKPFLILMTVLSWFSLAFAGKKSIKRFLPVSLFMAIVVTLVQFIAKKRRWWLWYGKRQPSVLASFPFTWGSFFASSLWIMKYTYGNFKRYIGLNLIWHLAFTYVGEPILKKFGIASLVRMKKIQLMYVFMILALTLYGFQIVKEKSSTYKNRTKP
ncbi:hypothetical protein NSA56_03935 [Oceanobacillus caeni]|uniref:hypothetical protein n=1 Tax=Oceanobacillus TaxID=182709 RepID=UPI00214A184E|nr:hypothetical protein [Oceanobacillus caeni]MCR1833544.1 hypothetical protein [Oceanobacillus caeni]